MEDNRRTFQRQTNNVLQTCFSRVLWLNCIALSHTCTKNTSLKKMSMEAEQEFKEKCSSKRNANQRGMQLIEL